jgi:hypothetical protein
MFWYVMRIWKAGLVELVGKTVRKRLGKHGVLLTLQREQSGGVDTL